MKHYIIISLVTLVLFYGCSTSTNRQLRRFIGDSISLDFEPKEIVAGFESGLVAIEGNIPKLIVYIDSTECSTCRISRLQEYNDIFYRSLRDRNFKILVIFAPKKSEIQTVKMLMEYYAFPHSVYIDENNEFYNQNKAIIPEDKILHTFLVDKNNNVVLAGDPINNDQLTNLYFKEINQLE